MVRERQTFPFPSLLIDICLHLSIDGSIYQYTNRSTCLSFFPIVQLNCNGIHACAYMHIHTTEKHDSVAFRDIHMCIPVLRWPSMPCSDPQKQCAYDSRAQEGSSPSTYILRMSTCICMYLCACIYMYVRVHMYACMCILWEQLLGLTPRQRQSIAMLMEGLHLTSMTALRLILIFSFRTRTTKVHHHYD